MSFEALGQQAFLDTVRTLVGEEVPDHQPGARARRPTAPPSADGRDALARAGVQFLEALANLCTAAARSGADDVADAAAAGGGVAVKRGGDPGAEWSA